MRKGDKRAKKEKKTNGKGRSRGGLYGIGRGGEERNRKEGGSRRRPPGGGTWVLAREASAEAPQLHHRLPLEIERIRNSGGPGAAGARAGGAAGGGSPDPMSLCPNNPQFQGAQGEGSAIPRAEWAPELRTTT